MQTMKILLLLALTCGFCLAVEFEPCPHALIGESCNMTCHVPDFSKTILILCNGVTRGSCSTFLGCGSNVIQEGGNKAHLKISSLSYTSDSCEWSCTYGTNSSSPLNVTIYSGISNLNLTSEINADGVKLTAIADCLYPYDPIVDVQYSIELDGQYASLSQQVDLQSSTTPGGCSDAIERRVTATYDVSAKHAELKGKSVFFRMKFSQYPSGEFNFTNTKGSFFFEGLTTPSSTINSDMSTTVSEPSPTFSSDKSEIISVPSSTLSLDMPTTVSEASLPPMTTSSEGLSQEIMITVVISSGLAAGGLILLVVLVVRQCRRKNKGTAVKNKENHFLNKQNHLTKKDDLKSYKTRKSMVSEKKNTKLGSASLHKKKDTHLENFACKDRMYQHYPQTSDYWNHCGNQHVFNISHNEGNIMFYGNRHDNFLRPHSRPNNKMLYQYHYPEYPGHNEEMFQYNRADNLHRGKQTYQRPYVALYDMNIIDDKQDEKRSFKGRPYEKNWDLLY